MLNLDENVTDLPHLVLGSGSPRRAEILTSVGWPFEVDVPDIDESELANESPESYVLRLAKQKAEAISHRHPERSVLAADTTVVVNGQILGKPIDRDDAIRMITMLAGNTHEVLTGVAIIRGRKISSGIQRTKVRFTEMTESEIHFLVDRGDPFDKAGGYAVQAQAALFIAGIEGDYWNVVGLPVNLVYSLIREMDV